MKKKSSKKTTRPKAGQRAALAGAIGSTHFINFNINDSVQVRLTEFGRECLQRNHDAIAAAYRAQLPFAFSLPQEDRDGWSTWQMWTLMEAFGPHMWIGGKNPFDLTMRIEMNRSNIGSETRRGQEPKQDGH